MNLMLIVSFLCTRTWRSRHASLSSFCAPKAEACCVYQAGNAVQECSPHTCKMLAVLLALKTELLLAMSNAQSTALQTCLRVHSAPTTLHGATAERLRNTCNYALYASQTMPVVFFFVARSPAVKATIK
jgi:hypothetical protein